MRDEVEHAYLDERADVLLREDAAAVVPALARALCAEGALCSGASDGVPA